jgi:uncharacterized protein
MATSYKTPGVYVEEIPKLPPSVAQVETAIPAFIGYTQRTGIEGAPLPSITRLVNGVDVKVTEAKRITSLLEYETYFGTGPNETVSVNIEEVYRAGTTELKRRSIKTNIAAPSKHTMYYHMQLYFANGGGPCYIISIGDTTAANLSKDNYIEGLNMVKKYDEPTLLVFPQVNRIADVADNATEAQIDAGGADMYTIYNQALAQAAELKDRFVVMDCYRDDAEAFRRSTTLGNNNLKYGAVYHPYLRTSLSYLYDVNDAVHFIVSYKRDLNDDGDFTDVDETGSPTFTSLPTELQSLVRLELNKMRVVLPPSSAVVGVYALVDSTRGVWKAPANVSLSFVSGLTKMINETEQAGLNVDTTAGKSINVIRAFTGKGILIWGARTLAGNDNEWRYIPVRRFFNMVEESSKKATEPFVFEPNDANTWIKVQGMLENFLTTMWRQGALQGAKPEHAFYVSVGLNKTMTALDILEGRMIVEIGMAVVRPAEFIILRFSHKMAES